ncbi:hypothetical protein ABFY68_30110 [Paenibacillus validus]
MDACIVGMTFSDREIVYPQYQVRGMSGILPHTFLKTRAFRRQPLLMLGLECARGHFMNFSALFDGSRRCRANGLLFKSVRVPFASADKGILPDETTLAIITEHPDGRG